MDEIRREAWSLYKYGDWSQGIHLTVKEKIAALRLLKDCDEAKFALLEKGPSVLNVKGMGLVGVTRGSFLQYIFQYNPRHIIDYKYYISRRRMVSYTARN
jgi:hypothetical protein